MPAQILDPFSQIHPGRFISQYSDWILVTLLIFFFWSVAGIALYKHFQESRHLRFLVTSVALFMAIGTYYSVYNGWLKFSMQGLGLIGVFLLFIVVFFILFGLIRGYGVSVFNALPISYALLYIGLWAVSPNIFDNIAAIFPLGNFILLVLFIIALVKVVTGFLHHSKLPLDMKDLKTMRFNSIDDAEIIREIDEDKKERQLIKGKTIKLTQNNLKTLNDAERFLKRIITIIQKQGNHLDPQQQAEIINNLRQINKNSDILNNGFNLIKKHVSAYNVIHKKDMSELKKRLAQTANERQKKIIEAEIQYQQKMIQIIDFLARNESKVFEFTKNFNRLLNEAFQKMKGRNPSDALSYLSYALKNLLEMKDVYEKQKDFEKYLLKLNKKTIRSLKKEKDQ